MRDPNHMNARAAVGTGPGAPIRWRGHVPEAEPPAAAEGAAGAGGAGAGVAAEAAVAKPAEAAVQAPVAPAKPAEPQVAKVEEAAKPAPTTDPLAAKLAELEAAAAKDREKIAELEAAAAKDAKDLRDTRVEQLLDKVKVADAYRPFARTALAAIDPTTDVGKAAVDAFATAHPAMLDLPRQGAGDVTMDAFITSKAKALPGSAWTHIPPSALAKVTVD